MALSVPTMQTTIKSALDAQYGPPAGAGPLAEQTKFTLALATALQTILTAQVVVSVTSVSAVTPGVGASGPGVGVLT
mgnify:CR=1 FL=1